MADYIDYNPTRAFHLTKIFVTVALKITILSVASLAGKRVSSIREEGDSEKVKGWKSQNQHGDNTRDSTVARISIGVKTFLLFYEGLVI